MNSAAELKNRFLSNIQILPNGCWHWLKCRNRAGYGRIGYCGNVYLANRISLYLFEEFNLHSTLEACHKCDNPSCVNPNHLFVGTHQENMLQSFKRGRSKLAPRYHGEKNKMSKLSNRQATRVRNLYKTGKFTQRGLAKKFGVCQATIRDIVNRKSYKLCL